MNSGEEWGEFVGNIVIICLMVAIVYVAAHFIIKFW